MKFAKKEQINEEQLLADAKLWFEQKHGKSPEECDVKFIKVWHTPTPLVKTTAVVFAKTEKAGKAFIWEQNVIRRTLRYSWILPIYGIATFFTICSQETKEDIIGAGIFCLTPIFFTLCLYLHFAWKCKKLKKIHQGNVDVYYA